MKQLSVEENLFTSIASVAYSIVLGVIDLAEKINNFIINVAIAVYNAVYSYT